MATTANHCRPFHSGEVHVGVKGSGNSLRFKLYNEEWKENYEDGLLVMVDGIPLSDPNKIFSIDPLKIRQLDVINRRYIFGDTILNGLANFASYTGFYDGLPLDQGTIVVDYEGLQLQREFYSPEYSSDLARNSRLPDLRTTLQWVPDVATKQLSFYTGDTRGRYLIVMQGMDGNGRAVSAMSEIMVE